MFKIGDFSKLSQVSVYTWSQFTNKWHGHIGAFGYAGNAAHRAADQDRVRSVGNVRACGSVTAHSMMRATQPLTEAGRLFFVPQGFSKVVSELSEGLSPSKTGVD